MVLDDLLGGRRAGHHLEREAGRGLGAAVHLVRALRQRQGLLAVDRGQPALADGDARRDTRLGRVGIGQQHLLDDLRGLIAVAAAHEQAWHRIDQRRALGSRRRLDQRLQRLDDLGRAVQLHQQLHLVAQRVGRVGDRQAPGLHRHHRFVAGPALQRNLGGAAEQLLILRAPGRVEDQLIGRPQIAFAQFDLADQQLLEQRPVQRRVLDLLGLRPGVLCPGRRDEEKRRQQRGQCVRTAGSGIEDRHRLTPEAAIDSRSRESDRSPAR